MHNNRQPSSAMLAVECFIYLNGLFILTTSGFNIEHRLPILKSGPKGSLFGLSIAQHHITANSKQTDNAVLLVGAPTADRAPEHSADSVKPGGLYRCGMTPGEDCTRIIVADSVNTLRANSSHQWLGVKVKSHKPGGKIVVCAHRYTIRGGARQTIAWEAAIGRCFLLENTMVPARNRLSWEWVPCLGKQDPMGGYTHEWYGYCQAGTAVDFADVPKNGAGDEEFIVFGAPGSFFWSGMIQASSVTMDLFGDSPTMNSGPGVNWDDKKNLSHKNSLLGSSIASGVLLNFTTNAVNFVSGAPGSNTTGSVVIFEKREQGFDQRLVLVETIHGDKIASRFGHEVQLVDVTGDGRLDLIVGAPQYFDRDLNLGGAVYIYVNKGLGQIGPQPSQILFGKVDSQFGLSIAKIGDVNMDGADDIAIGAPGEDNRVGAVYIYHGNNQDGTMGVHEEPSQVIRASELMSMGHISGNISGMGYAVSGGLDMDFNGYPDIALGSLSDTVVMFLSRPIVNIVGTIKGPDNRISSERLNTGGYNITVCLSYTSSPSTFNNEVQTTATIKLDTARLDTDLLPRASFSSSDLSESEKTIKMKLYPQSQNKKKCKSLKVYIDKDLQDKLSPIELGLTFDTPDSDPKRKRRATDIPVPMPIMNAAIDNTATAIIEFSKDCGGDEICKSKLSMSAYYEVLRGETWEKIEENEDNIPVLKLGTEKQIGMMITIQNPYPGEDAHQAQLSIELPNVLEYRSIDQVKRVSDLHCEPDLVNRTLVMCYLGNPFLHSTEAQFRVKLSKNKTEIYKSTGFDVNLQLLTTSQQPGHDQIRAFPVIVLVEAQLRIVGYTSDNQVPFSGKVIGESAVKKATDAGVILKHTYEVENTGTGPADNVELHIKWPQTLKNGKWLFYLLEVDVSGDRGNCTLPHDVNPLGLAYAPGSVSERNKREVEGAPGDEVEVTTKELIKKPPANVYEELICPDSATCVEFTCSLGTIDSASKVFITLYSILWNSTFLEEYEGVSQIKVTSSARVSIAQDNIKFSQLSKLNDTVSIDVLASEILAPETEVKWWIIALATLAGVILLVGIILLLWKCGFFKRRKFGDYQKARRHKQASKKADERETLY